MHEQGRGDASGRRHFARQQPPATDEIIQLDDERPGQIDGHGCAYVSVISLRPACTCASLHVVMSDVETERRVSFEHNASVPGGRAL